MDENFVRFLYIYIRIIVVYYNDIAVKIIKNNHQYISSLCSVSSLILSRKENYSYPDYILNINFYTLF